MLQTADKFLYVRISKRRILLFCNFFYPAEIFFVGIFQTRRSEKLQQKFSFLFSVRTVVHAVIGFGIFFSTFILLLNFLNVPLISAYAPESLCVPYSQVNWYQILRISLFRWQALHIAIDFFDFFRFLGRFWTIKKKHFQVCGHLNAYVCNICLPIDNKFCIQKYSGNSYSMLQSVARFFLIRFGTLESSVCKCVCT